MKQIVRNNQDFFFRFRQNVSAYLNLESFGYKQEKKSWLFKSIFSCLAFKIFDCRNQAIISKNLVYNILFFATDLLQNCRDFCYSYRRQLVSLLPGSVIAAWAGKQGCLHKKGGLRRHVISVLQIYTTFAKHTWVWEQEWMWDHSETTLQIYFCRNYRQSSAYKVL